MCCFFIQVGSNGHFHIKVWYRCKYSRQRNSIWAATWDFQYCGMCDQQSLRSESLLVAWILSVKILGVSKLKRRPHKLVGVYTELSKCPLLEIKCRSSFHLSHFGQLMKLRFLLHICLMTRKTFMCNYLVWLLVRYWVLSLSTIMINV